MQGAWRAGEAGGGGHCFAAARPRRGGGGRACGLGQLPRHADHREQVPVQTAAAVFAGRRGRRHDQGAGAGRRGVQARRARHRRVRLGRLCRRGGGARAQAGAPGRRRGDGRRGLAGHHLRHHALRSERARAAEAGRDAAGAGRGRRHGLVGGGAGQADGRARHRRRVQRGEAGAVQAVRRRRGHRLQPGRTCANA